MLSRGLKWFLCGMVGVALSWAAPCVYAQQPTPQPPPQMPIEEQIAFWKGQVIALSRSLQACQTASGDIAVEAQRAQKQLETERIKHAKAEPPVTSEKKEGEKP